MTDEQDTPSGEPRKTWQERNAEATTKEAKATLAAEWTAADDQIERALRNGSSGGTRALEQGTKALERWSRESRGIPAKQYAIWVRDADTALEAAANEELVQLASNESETPEAAMQAFERAESLADHETCYDAETLKRRTLAVCARKFHVMAKCEWEALPEWALYTIEQCRSDLDNKIERQAEKAMGVLRDAVLAIRSLPSEGGAVRAAFVRHLARELHSKDIDALLEHSSKDPIDINTMGLGTVNFRQKLAVFWTLARHYLREKRDPISAPYPSEIETARPLASADELAVVAILAGDWPEKMKTDWQKGVTPRAVIDSVKGGFAAKDGALIRAQSVISAGAGVANMGFLEKKI